MRKPLTIRERRILRNCQKGRMLEAAYYRGFINGLTWEVFWSQIAIAAVLASMHPANDPPWFLPTFLLAQAPIA